MIENADAISSGEVAVSTVDVVTSKTGATDRRPLEPIRKKRSNSLFWGISGGSILGAVGFVGLTLYQQYNDSIVELQRDLKHFNTTCADLVKKDDLGHRFKMFWTTVEKLDNNMKEKAERLALMEHLLKNSEDERKEQTRELQRLRERLAAVEARQSMTLPTSVSAEK